jgi:hypothetical protein
VKVTTMRLVSTLAVILLVACGGDADSGADAGDPDDTGDGGHRADAGTGPEPQPDAATGGPFTLMLTRAPEQLTFQPQLAGTPSGSQRFTVTNVGPSPTGPLTDTFTPSLDARHWQLSHSCAQGLAPGMSCAVDVVFFPQESTAGGGTITLLADGHPQLELPVTGSAHD